MTTQRYSRVLYSPPCRGTLVDTSGDIYGLLAHSFGTPGVPFTEVTTATLWRICPLRRGFGAEFRTRQLARAAWQLSASKTVLVTTVDGRRCVLHPFWGKP